MKRPSASSVEAFVSCPASHVLPQHESHGGEAQAAGHEGHELLCAHYNGVLGATERLELELPGLAKKLARHHVNVEMLSAEDAYVVNVETRTSRQVGRNIGRRYEKALGRKLEPFEVGVSLDLGGWRGVPWLRDFKFGITSSWWQLYIQAMALLWLPGREAERAVDAGFIFIENHEDRGISVTSEEATLYMMDLDDRADEAMEAFRAAELLEAELLEEITPPSHVRTVEGKWCTYCGAFPHCPSKWKLAKSMLSLDIANSIDALTPEQCGDAWLKLAEIKKNIVKKTEAALKARMRAEGGFPTPDGKLVKLLPMPGRLGFDQAGAIALMQELGATEEEMAPLLRRGAEYEQVHRVNRKATR